jgi:hypothetical protein
MPAINATKGCSAMYIACLPLGLTLEGMGEIQIADLTDRSITRLLQHACHLAEGLVFEEQATQVT